MYKKITITILLFILSLTLISCKPTPDDNGKDPGNGDENGGEIVDVDPKTLTSPNIKITEDENDPNYLDGKKYEYTGNWHSDDGEVENINQDYKYAGLYNPDGTVYEMPKENESTGKRLPVTDFGAIADDSEFDNTPAVKLAIDQAEPGDYIYFPKGTFYFKTQSIANPVMAHISLPSGVNLTGAGTDRTTLVSNFTEYDNLNKKTATIAVVSESNITISGVKLTAEVPEESMPQKDPTSGELSTTGNNPEGNKHAPKYGVYVINNEVLEKAENIVVKNVEIEHFQVSGVELTSTIASTVKDSTIRRATDIGGGGRGYGVTIQGNGHESFFAVGTNLDSRYNVVSNIDVEGPFIRHAIILSYVTHNNLIFNNRSNLSQDQPLDLHGEDEFLNVFSKNEVIDGASTAIGLGNPGSTHDATGPANIVYDNIADNFSGGVTISHGTPDTVLIDNEFINLREDGVGIDLMFAPNVLIRGNTINKIPGANAVGIFVKYSYVYYAPEEGVIDVYIADNDINDIDEGVGIKLIVYGDDSVILENKMTNVTTEFEDTKLSFDVPEKSDYTTEVIGENVFTTQEGNINRGSWDDVVRNRGYFWFKGSHLEPEFNRMIFYDWDLTDVADEIDASERIVIKLTVTTKSALQRFFFHGSEELYGNWDEMTMTWGNAPYINTPTNNDQLEVDESGKYPTSDYPYLSEIYDPNEELEFITDFTVLVIDESYITYYIDITDYVKNLETNKFTMILSNPTADEAYTSVRNKIGNRNEVWPAIIIED